MKPSHPGMGLKEQNGKLFPTIPPLANGQAFETGSGVQSKFKPAVRIQHMHEGRGRRAKVQWCLHLTRSILQILSPLSLGVPEA
eukprot:scaffold114914_cov43-Cyclotella_meneghiniana.AAC.2